MGKLIIIWIVIVILFNIYCWITDTYKLQVKDIAVIVTISSIILIFTFLLLFVG